MAPPVPKLPFSPGSSVPFASDIGVSPAIALLSSFLLVFAIFPSLNAISVFAAALTYAFLESERPAVNVPPAVSHFWTRTEADPTIKLTVIDSKKVFVKLTCRHSLLWALPFLRNFGES